MLRFMVARAEKHSGLPKVLRPIAAIWFMGARIAKRARNRRAVARLATWDAHTLKDIGLTPSDVHLALAVPLHEDPSTRLMFWSLERRSARMANYRDMEARARKSRVRLDAPASRAPKNENDLIA
ncbi:protein of unknown function [Faunimonas pinastri]|uniref:YjiS-like domain-containing protein n=1 Tax=Faunimonas pinastri TaxID=1855383 RepID=A0A1H8ZJC6_9HYPH|nr:DUF1127 domain-containing protein [Faunimonas pinastri]SEP63808.1 protein of unknown function [Faunimonas pinastri]